jgi:DNA-binding beta-propeller fold protein YncE
VNGGQCEAIDNGPVPEHLSWKGGFPMKDYWGRGLGLGLLAVFFAACSSGGNGNNTPPPTVYNYYAYLVNSDWNTISGYTINTTTGALTAVTGSPFAAGSVPSSVAVDPSGKFAYVTNGDDTISGYTINSSTGALTAMSGSPFAAGNGAWGIAITRVAQ